MFGVGTWEMVVVAIVAMLLFKPSELPKMLRTVSRFWGQLRATADEFKDTIMTADGMDELQDLVKSTKSELRGVESDARKEMMKARAQMRKAQQKLALTHKAREEQRAAARPKPPEKRPEAGNELARTANTAPTPPPPPPPTPPVPTAGSGSDDVNQGAA